MHQADFGIFIDWFVHSIGSVNLKFTLIVCGFSFSGGISTVMDTSRESRYFSECDAEMMLSKRIAAFELSASDVVGDKS